MKKRTQQSLLFLLRAAFPLMLVAAFLFASARFVLQLQPNTAMAEDVTRIVEKTFGISAEGREITGYEIGDGENVLLLFGAIHGDERGTKDMLERLVEEIARKPSRVADDKKLVIIPLVNPDGYFTREDKLNANAVNLNRNFATDEWIVQEDQDDPETYAGEKPFTEIESNLIRTVVEEYRPDVMIAYHSLGALVSPEENEVSVALGRWYASRSGYSFFDEWDYAGTATRWFVETTGGAAITVELTDHVRSDWSKNRAALFELIGQ